MSFYLVPMIGSGTRADPRRPKYVAALGVMWQCVDMADTGIVYANASPADDATIAANADARVIPPLDSTVAVNATQQALEDMNLPAQWVTAAMSYRTVLRVVVGMAQLVQCVTGLGQTLTLAGNLNATVGSLPAALRTALSTASDLLSIDRTGVVGSTTVREVLRMFGQQFAAGRTIKLGDL